MEREIYPGFSVSPFSFQAVQECLCLYRPPSEVGSLTVCAAFCRTLLSPRLYSHHSFGKAITVVITAINVLGTVWVFPSRFFCWLIIKEGGDVGFGL